MNFSIKTLNQHVTKPKQVRNNRHNDRWGYGHVSTNIMEQHTAYEHIRSRPCDFIVKYRFFTSEEGGRKTGPPTQGYRSDFMYEGDNPKTDKIYMIHPEFIDDGKNVILDKTLKPWSGKANMWILNSDFLQYHKNRIRIGVKGFFMEGGQKTAGCEVIEIVGLKPRLKFNEYRDLLFRDLFDSNYQNKLFDFITQLSINGYTKQEIYELFLEFHKEIQVDPRTNNIELFYDKLSDFMDGFASWGKSWRILPNEPDI